jgi:tripartite-type tricarboxylate transporter receptor subunit TctC
MFRTIAVVAAFGAALAGAVAHAGEYPEKPIRFILPNAAGGSPDTIARILAVRLTDILGQQFIIDNRPGAGGIIAAETVAKANPDGYTLLQCGISQTISPALKRKLPYDTWSDFTRIVQFGGVPTFSSCTWDCRYAPWPISSITRRRIRAS